MTRQESARISAKRDHAKRMVLSTIKKTERRRNTPPTPPLVISGKRTTLGELMDRALERVDARKPAK